MLIQSQNQRIIVNSHTMVCMYLNEEECSIRCITTNSDNDFGYVMANYNSKEEAQNAMNTFRDNMNKTPCYKF